jgi:hypothetical protein
MDSDDEQTNLPARTERGTWVKGAPSPWPAGRGKNTPNKFSKKFLVSLAASWEQHGDAVLAEVRERDAVQYLRICASLIPRQIAITTETRPITELSEQELIGIIVEDSSKWDQAKKALEPLVDRVTEFDPVLADEMRMVLDYV